MSNSLPPGVREEPESHPVAEEIVRIETRRTITYQGPRNWAEGCVARSIIDTVEMGPGKFVIGGPIEQTEVMPGLAIELDRSLKMHLERNAEMTRRERGIKQLEDAADLIGRYLDATVADAAVCPACNRRTYEAAADYYERQSLTAVISKLRKIIDRRKSGAQPE